MPNPDERPPKATPDELDDDEGTQPPLRDNRPTAKRGFSMSGGGGSIVQIAVIAIIAALVVFLGMGYVGGGSVRGCHQARRQGRAGHDCVPHISWRERHARVPGDDGPTPCRVEADVEIDGEFVPALRHNGKPLSEDADGCGVRRAVLPE